MAMFQAGAVSETGTRSLRPRTAVAMLSSVVNRSGQRYWFHPNRKRMMDSAAILARERGNKISKKNLIGPAPSRRAASQSSSGTVRKN
ncbi:hypothetical protein D3C86_1948060 [compost metagenome]